MKGKLVIKNIKKNCTNMYKYLMQLAVFSCTPNTIEFMFTEFENGLLKKKINK